MSAKSLRDSVRKELKLRLLPIIEEDFQRPIKVDANLFFLESLHRGWDDEWESFSTSDLFTIGHSDQSFTKVRVVAGSIGAGKTTLARYILQCWLTCDSYIKNVNHYEGIFILDGEILEIEEALTLIQSILPDTIQLWGIDCLFDWIEEANILLIVDDFLIDSGQKSKLLTLLEEWKGTDILLLTNIDDSPRALSLISLLKPAVYCRFKKLETLFQSRIINYVLKNNNSTCPKQIDSMLSTLMNVQPLLTTFGGIIYICKFFTKFSKNISLSRPCSLANLVWTSVHEHLNEAKEKYSLPSDYLEEWLISLGKRCYECFTSSSPLLGEEVLHSLESTNNLFPHIVNTDLVELLLTSRRSLYRNNTLFCIPHKVLQEVLASYYLLKRNFDATPLRTLLKHIKIQEYDNLAVYFGGLSSMVARNEAAFFDIDETNLRKKEIKIERALKHLSLQKELSPDPITYMLKLLNEMECHAYLTKLFLYDIVLPANLHVHDEGIYSGALNQLINHSMPVKIHLLTRRNHFAPQMKAVLKLIRKYDLNLALADMNHLNWNGEYCSNDLIKILFEENCKITLQDFIGCLNENTVTELHKYETTRHLVCLRARACNSATALSLVESQNHLKQLMWLEIDFDFPLCELFELELPRISTPLVDLSFKDVTDQDIKKLCDFLHSVSQRYSGIHIHKSFITPQGVTEILKYFYKRSMVLNADRKVISKYRKYRFPEMASVDPTRNLSDEEVERLLGYDDRHHYSDNEVWSSYVASKFEIQCLQGLFSMFDVTYFVYNCANYKVIKQTNGDCIVETVFS